MSNLFVWGGEGVRKKSTAWGRRVRTWTEKEARMGKYTPAVTLASQEVFIYGIHECWELY